MKLSDGAARSAGLEIVEDDCLVVFKGLPLGCPQLGLDPRLLADRGPDGDRVQIVGIWEPYTTVRVPMIDHSDTKSGSPRLDKEGVRNGEENKEVQPEVSMEEEDGEGQVKPSQAQETLVIFATRYLIAQEPRSG